MITLASAASAEYAEKTISESSCVVRVLELRTNSKVSFERTHGSYVAYLSFAEYVSFTTSGILDRDIFRYHSFEVKTIVQFWISFIYVHFRYF